MAERVSLRACGSRVARGRGLYVRPGRPLGFHLIRGRVTARGRGHYKRVHDPIWPNLASGHVGQGLRCQNPAQSRNDALVIRPSASGWGMTGKMGPLSKFRQQQGWRSIARHAHSRQEGRPTSKRDQFGTRHETEPATRTSSRRRAFARLPRDARRSRSW